MFDKLIPSEIRIFVGLVAVAWIGYQLFDYSREVSDTACALQRSDEKTVGSESLRSQESQTTANRNEAIDEFTDRTREIQVQLDGARSASDALRVQLAAAVRRASQCGAQGDPSSQQGGQAAAALGAVFAACEAEQREMAKAAAEHLSAGLLCEGEFSAVAGEPLITPEKGSGQ